MKANVWLKKKIVIYIGGNPEKGENPVITLEMDNMQAQFDTDKNAVIIFESK